MLVRMLVRLITCSTLALTLSAATTGCIGLGKNAGAPLEVAPSANFAAAGIGGFAGFQSTVYQYALANCAGCHSTLQAPYFASSDVSTAYAQALTVVDFNGGLATVVQSPFITQMNNNHCSALTTACNNNGTVMFDATTGTGLLAEWYQATLATGASTGGDATLIGNVFTNGLNVPTPGTVNSPSTFSGNPTYGGDGCASPSTDQACTFDGLNNTSLNPNLTPMACQNVCWTKLRYPVPLMSPAPSATMNRAWFEIDFAYDSYPDATTGLGGSYVIANPRVVTLDGPVYIHDIRLFLNGIYQANYAGEYQDVDMVVNQWTPPTTTNGAPTCILANPSPFPDVSGFATAPAYNPVAATPPPANLWALPANATPAQVTTFSNNIQSYIANIEACNIPAVPNVYSTAVKSSGILQVQPAVCSIPGVSLVNCPGSGGVLVPQDTISFSFDYFQPGSANPCSDQMMWWNNIYSTIKGQTWLLTAGTDGQQAKAGPVIGGVVQQGQMLCLNCHRSGGNVTEAGQRFNMDDTDSMNCPAAPSICSGSGVTKGQCLANGGTWSSGCSDTGFTTSASCQAQGGSWQGACSQSPTTLLTQTACNTAGYVWYTYNTWLAATWADGSLNNGICTNISQSACTTAYANSSWVGACPGPGCACSTAEAQTTVCGKFLQRSNLGDPQDSEIITQPADGLNGMPEQANFTVYESRSCNGVPCGWLDWINQEATNAGK